MKELHLNQSQMKVWAKDFAQRLKSNTLILLEGDLGAGKTFLVQSIVKELSQSEITCSPTYALHNTYLTTDFKVEHFDLYRLENFADLEAAGFFEALSEEDNVVFVEWANRLPEKALPFNRSIYRIHLEIDGDARRLQIQEVV